MMFDGVNILLSKREPDLREKMDDPACDHRQLFNTYRHFACTNALFSGWKRIYARHMRPELKHSPTPALLDIGAGGGDIPRALRRLAKSDGIDLRVTAIDEDARAVRYMLPRVPDDGMTIRQCASRELVEEGARYDFVISNNVLHHLERASFGNLLNDARALAKRRVIMNDIHRSPVAYAVYTVLTAPWARRSFIGYDGRISIRRSYTYRELKAVAPPGWDVLRLFPYRLLLVHSR